MSDLRLALGAVRLTTTVHNGIPKLVVHLGGATRPTFIGTAGSSTKLGQFLMEAGQWMLDLKNNPEGVARIQMGRAFAKAEEILGFNIGDRFTSEEKKTLRTCLFEGRKTSFVNTICFALMFNNPEPDQVAFKQKVLEAMEVVDD